MKKFLIVSISFILGCAAMVPHHTFTKTGFTEIREPCPDTDNYEIVVLTRLPSDLEYDELGICNAYAPGGGLIADNTPMMIKELKKCACLNGGNAIAFSMNDIKSTGLHGMEASQQKIEGFGTVLFVRTK